MKKYFQISQSSEPKIIGVRNGVHQGEIVWENFKSNSAENDFLNNLFTLDKFKANQIQPLPEGIEIEYVKAYKMAKMTDIFGFTPALYGISYFISSKFKEVLEKFNLSYVQFIPVHIYQEDNHFEYWAPYISKHYNEENFDFKKSIFYEKTYGANKPIVHVTVNNMVDYISRRFNIEPEVLFYNDKFESNLDLLISLNCYGFVVSEQLKDTLVEAKITGINIWDSKPKIFAS